MNANLVGKRANVSNTRTNNNTAAQIRLNERTAGMIFLPHSVATEIPATTDSNDTAPCAE
jgi:hypothetical protein